MEAAGFRETLVPPYVITWHDISEDGKPESRVLFIFFVLISGSSRMITESIPFQF